MKFLYLSLFVGLFSGNSIAQNYNIAAYQFHQSIVLAQQKIGKEVYYYNESATALNLKILKFEIKKNIAFIDSLKIYNNEVTYHEAAKKLFQFYSDLAEHEYAELLVIIEDPELEFKDFKKKKEAIFAKIKTKSSKAYPPFTKAQEDFCKKYSIKLE